MKEERRSAAEEKHLRWKEEEEEGWRCRKHPFQPPYGVCPACLRDRLLRLCLDCANERASCACAPFSSSSSSSSSPSSSFSSLSFPADLPRSGTTGATGRVSSLIEREPPFQRSGSVGVAHVPRSRSIAAATGGGGSGEERRRGWAAGLWAFARKGSAAEGWKWHFPSPMNLLRHRRSEASGRARRCTSGQMQFGSVLVAVRGTRDDNRARGSESRGHHQAVGVQEGTNILCFSSGD